MAKNNFKHGQSDTPTYNSWKAMRIRVAHRDDYKDIHICGQWKNDYLTFLKDMGERPDGTTLDRINPWGDYCPGNCRWANAHVQNMNKRGFRRWFVKGEYLTIGEISDKYSVPMNLLKHVYDPHRTATVDSILKKRGVLL